MELSGWYNSVAASIAEQLPSTSGVRERLVDLGSGGQGSAAHLAVFVEPFLGFVLDGTKIVESRFSVSRHAPYQSVKSGDVILIKAASGPIVAVCVAACALDFRITDARVLDTLRLRYGRHLRAEFDDFWDQRRTSRFATVVELGGVWRLETPLPCPKKDRRGWVVLDSARGQLGLLGSAS